ncbi:hypothetical protein EDB19DRAFT_1839611 [Suillus lakei]|nr:hypothetical protein EDB19DRAFT_1839611 [Suillus lakei]
MLSVNSWKMQLLLKIEYASLAFMWPQCNLADLGVMSVTSQKPTVSRQAVNSQYTSSSQRQPDPQTIRQSVNAAQQKCESFQSLIGLKLILTMTDIVPEAQWTEFEDWQEANEMAIERTSHHAKGKGKADPLFANSGESYTYSADPPFNSAYPLFDSEHSSHHVKGKGKADPLFADSGESHTYPADPPFDSESAPNISSAAATVPAPVTATGIVIKRTHERVISSTSSTISPPRKYIAPHNPPPALLCSPNCNDLKIALKMEEVLIWI